MKSWSKETEKNWKAFINAVASRDKNQFALYVKYASTKQKNNLETEEEQLTL